MTRPRNTNSPAKLLTPVRVMTAERKFWICDALRRNRITRAQVMAAHDMSGAELDRWMELYNRDGLEGLRSINRRKRAA